MSGRTIAGLGLAVVLVMSASGMAQPPGSQPGSVGSPPTPPAVSEPAPPPSVPPQPGGSQPVPGGFSGGSPNGQPFAGPGGFTGFQQQGVAFSGRGGGPVPRFTFTIDPNTATDALLPKAPWQKRIPGPLTTDDLAKVPEVAFQAKPAKDAAPADLTKETAHQLAKMSHMNAKKTDAFVAALIENRPDLVGLPFAMGDSCRTHGERSRQFTRAVALVRQALGQIQGNPANSGHLFWQQYTALTQQDDAGRGRTDRALAEHVALARAAALVQMLAAESADVRVGLAKHLAGVSHVEATHALARLAIFSAEDDVRLAALDALRVRREKDYTDILVKGLSYPYPAVAKRAADAIARLERKDLIPELVAVLERDDARAPVTTEVDGKKTHAVRELVKLNHHRNCMLCHSPGNPGTVPADTLTAEVPVQGQPLPTPAQGYGRSSPDLMVRIDVTYLRQDFSVMMPVLDEQPWPESQRFDFFVRERKLTDKEAAAYWEALTLTAPGEVSPYHKAALAALRDLTGKDTAPTAEAWRKLLFLPKKGEVARD